MNENIPMNENLIMKRRMEKIQKEDPRIVVNQALGALSQLPEDVQKEYAPALIKTQMQLEKGMKNGY